MNIVLPTPTSPISKIGFLLTGDIRSLLTIDLVMIGLRFGACTFFSNTSEYLSCIISFA